MWNGSNARSLCDGFTQRGHDVRTIDITPMVGPRRMTAAWHTIRTQQRVLPSVNQELREQMAHVTTGWKPDLLVCFKTVLFDQEIFNVPGTRRIHYSPDDASNPDNISRQYLEAEHMWDLIVTTKRHNVSELVARGAQAVCFVWSAYDPRIHYPIAKPLAERRYLIGFIGAARPDRATLPRDLARIAPDKAVVIGPRWRRLYPLGIRHVHLTGPIAGSKFAYAAGDMKAGLVLLNSANRDLHTSRTFEMPGCGLLFVGQRTSEHEELFDADREALFFDGPDSLAETLLRVQRDEELVHRIAKAGYRRLIAGRHTYADRVAEIIACT